MAFADALADGRLALQSGVGVLQSRLSIASQRLHLYRDVLKAASAIPELVTALRSAALTAEAISSKQPLLEVAWTYPAVGAPTLRTTGGVAREIIDASQTSLLIVGFAVTVDSGAIGLAAQTVEAIARAAARGVGVTAVLHRTVNRNALLHRWRDGVPPPHLFTWPPGDDPMAAVHAKLIIADRHDAIVTSANLTYHGFERNLEMGIRVTGRVAAEIHDQIHQLIARADFIPWQD